MHTIKLHFVSAGLMTSGKGIDLDFKVFMTPDAAKPFMTQNVYTEMLALDAKPLPSAELELKLDRGDEESTRIFYLEELPGLVAIALNHVNLDNADFNVDWQCKMLEKHEDGSSEYVDTNLISVSGSSVDEYALSFANGIAEGTYRIILVVSDASDGRIVYLNIPYNFVVMSK